MIRFKKSCVLEIVQTYDEESDTVSTVSEAFAEGETVDCDILRNNNSTVDIQFGDGSVAYCLERGSIEMLDQYSFPVPNDLIVLDQRPKDFTIEQLQAIQDLKWYVSEDEEYKNIILVSHAELSEIVDLDDPTTLEDVDMELLGVKLVSCTLYRTDPERFYLA